MDLTKIEASLGHGKIFVGKLMLFIYISLIIMLFLPAITIIMLIITFTVGMDWTGEMIGTLIGSNIFVGLVIAVLVWIIIHNNNLRKKINIWLKDAVQVKALSKTIDFVRLGIQPKQIKIKVDFTIDGKKYSRVSASKMLGGGPEGYHKIWVHYADREINILYSPKYDEVLILKDKK